MDKCWGIIEEVEAGPDQVLARGLTQMEAEVALCRFINQGHDAYLIGGDGDGTHFASNFTEEEWIEEVSVNDSEHSSLPQEGSGL